MIDDNSIINKLKFKWNVNGNPFKIQLKFQWNPMEIQLKFNINNKGNFNEKQVEISMKCQLKFINNPVQKQWILIEWKSIIIQLKFQ